MSSSNRAIQEENYFKTVKLFVMIPIMVLAWIIEKGNTLKLTNQSYFDFFINNLGWESKTKMRKCFSRDEIEILDANKTPESLDITVMCKLVCNKYITKSKVRSQEYIDLEKDLEKYFNEMKDVKNKISHSTYHESLKLFGEKEEFKPAKDKCNKALDIAGKLFNNIKHEELDRKKDEFNEFVKKLDEEVLTVDARKERIVELAFQELKLFSETNYSTINPYVFYGNDFQSIVLSDIYIDLEIEKSQFLQKGLKLKVSNLMELFQNKRSSLSLIKGPPGAGKSTLIQYIIYEWSTTEKQIKGISNYDLVLFVQCRNRQIGGLRKYFERVLPDLFIHKSFNYSEFIIFLKKQKILILIDGLDEINEISKNIIEELFNTFSSSDIIMTSRPESVHITDNLKPDNKNMTTITLHGIPNESLDDFIKNYFDAISAQIHNPSKTKSPEKLSEILETCSKEVKDILKLPLNMSVIVYLYITEEKLSIDFQSVNNILFSIIESHEKKMQKRIREKVVNKSNIRFTKCLKIIKNKVEEIAFDCLIEGELILTDKTYFKLEDACTINDLPVEDVIAAYLTHKQKDISGCENPAYSYLHKSMQEFLAANYLLRMLEENCEDSQERNNAIMNRLILNDKFNRQYLNLMNILVSFIVKHDKKIEILNGWAKKIIECAFPGCRKGKIRFTEACDFLKFGAYNGILMEHLSPYITNGWIANDYYLEGARFLLQHATPKFICIKITSIEMSQSDILCKFINELPNENCVIDYIDDISSKDEKRINKNDELVEKIINRKCKLEKLAGFGSLSGRVILKLPKTIRYLELTLSLDDEAEQLANWLKSDGMNTVHIGLWIREFISAETLIDLKGKISFVKFIYELITMSQISSGSSQFPKNHPFWSLKHRRKEKKKSEIKIYNDINLKISNLRSPYEGKRMDVYLPHGVLAEVLALSYLYDKDSQVFIYEYELRNGKHVYRVFDDSDGTFRLKIEDTIPETEVDDDFHLWEDKDL